VLYSLKIRVAFCVKQNPLISGFPVWFRLVDATPRFQFLFSKCSAAKLVCRGSNISDEVYSDEIRRRVRRRSTRWPANVAQSSSADE